MCTKDKECEPGQWCNNGVCVARAAHGRRLIGALVALGLGIAVALASGCGITLEQRAGVGAMVTALRMRCESERKLFVGPPPATIGPVCSAAALCLTAADPIILGASPSNEQLQYALQRCKP